MVSYHIHIIDSADRTAIKINLNLLRIYVNVLDRPR